MNQVPKKLTSPIAFFKSLQSGLPMNLINTPMPRDSCQNDENPEKKNLKIFIFSNFFFLKIFIIWTTNPWLGGVYKAHGKSQLYGFKKRYGEVDFLGT